MRGPHALPLPDLARFAARGFTTLGKGYLFGGRLSDQTFSNGLWTYEPESDTWAPRTALPGIPRTYSFVWSLPEQAVVMGGDDLGFSNLQDCWYYDPLSDAWSPLAPYPGDAFWGGSSMVISGRIFAGLGRYGTDVVFDYWELKDLDTGLSTLVLDELRIGPNPVRPGSAITIAGPTGSTGLSAQLELHNSQGQLVHRARLQQQAVATTVLPTLSAGQYFASLVVDGQVRARSLLMVVD
ncbi:MAG: kelch repeat-containing protein [Flavobacteriales bacterium]